MIPSRPVEARPSPFGIENAGAPIDHLDGRIESVAARRFCIFATLVVWAFAAGAVLHASEVFFDPKDGLAGHLFFILVYAFLSAAAPWVWYRYARVVDVRGRTLFVRTTPGSTPRVYRRSDVADIVEGDGRQAGELRITFRDGRRLLVDRYYTGVLVLRLWIDHAVDGVVAVAPSQQPSVAAPSRIECVYGRRQAIGLAVLTWAMVGYTLRQATVSEIVQMATHPMGLFELLMLVAFVAAPLYAWYVRATVMELRGSTLVVRRTPWTGAKEYQRSDVAEVRDPTPTEPDRTYLGRGGPVLRIRFRDGRRLALEGVYTGLGKLRQWLDQRA